MGYRFKAKRLYRNGGEELVTEPEGIRLVLGSYSPDSKVARAFQLIRGLDFDSYFREKLNFSVAVDCLLNGRYRNGRRNFCLNCFFNGKARKIGKPLCAFLDPEYHSWFLRKENLRKQAQEIKQVWKQSKYSPF
ncbi:MAG: hypothetical protein J7J78_01335 [Thermoprotei archaeon]|nr:hypothetical protein [Thermoprotei archaeon]